MEWLNETNVFYLAQILGILAILLGFVTYIVKTRGQVLLVNSVTTLCFVLHYICLGAWAGMVMNVIACARNITYYYAGKKGKVSRTLSAFFMVIMAALGIAASLVAREGWYCILSILPLVINTFAMSFDDPNNIRKSILITSPMVLGYNCFVFSIGGAVYEAVAIVSAVIGLIRYRKQRIA